MNESCSSRDIFSATAKLMKWFSDIPSLFAKSFACWRVEGDKRSGKLWGRLNGFTVEDPFVALGSVFMIRLATTRPHAWSRYIQKNGGVQSFRTM
jgi:hypothetical protein